MSRAFIAGGWSERQHASLATVPTPPREAARSRLRAVEPQLNALRATEFDLSNGKAEATRAFHDAGDALVDLRT
jgi:hypothetical protein